MIIELSRQEYNKLLDLLKPDISIDEFIDTRFAKMRLKEVLDILGVTVKVDGFEPILEVEPLEVDPCSIWR